MTSTENPDAQRLLADFLVRLDRGEDVDIAELCDEHPEHAGSLRRLWDEHRRLHSFIDDVLPKGDTIFGRRKREKQDELGHVRTGDTIGEFTLIEPLGRGGMGQVWVAEQESLRRRVALKLVLPERASDQMFSLLAREARAAGRLSHPGIVAIYGHGEAEGLAWIAMELVEGAWTLRDALDEQMREDELPDGYYRRAAVMVGELAVALEAAHQAGVMHRDLKPANILIAEDDHAKITDFGLARITDESALSVTGDFAGTYYYMSPEQVAAKRIGLDHRTDIFSLGVVMYEMLALRRPFEGDTAQQVGYQIMQRDPPDLRALRSRLPKDLAVICGKCLEKDRAHRYQTMAELAADIRRHLSNEPIVAQPPSPMRKLHLWALRNPTKSVAGGVAAAAFVAISLLLVENMRARGKLEIAYATIGEKVTSLARLSALEDCDDLLAEADRLWPPHPENIQLYGKWIEDAQELADGLPRHYAKRDELRVMSAPPQGLSGEQDWVFPDTDNGRQSKWWHTNLSKLIDSLEELEDSATGLLSDAEDAVSEAHGWSVPRRLRFAERLRDGLAGGGEWEERWKEAIEAVADHEKYRGLALTRQVELVPIGPDPKSGLWEFWHVATGLEPVRGDDDELVLTEEMGLVMVLIPGGSFWMGAQAMDPAGQNYDAQALSDEGPVHQVTLSPYFLSKYEMTQGQWLHFVGRNPSQYGPHNWSATWLSGGGVVSLMQPVEQVSWDDCRRELERMGLSLPSEAQWENGCRAGTETPWWPGEEQETLRRVANLADSRAASHGGPSWPETAVGGWLDDGATVHAPVGRYAANAYGLHDVHGNLWEWCLDGYDGGYYGRGDRSDPVAPWESAAFRVPRGGGFDYTAAYARSAPRYYYAPSIAVRNLGVRPARGITTAPE